MLLRRFSSRLPLNKADEEDLKAALDPNLLKDNKHLSRPSMKHDFKYDSDMMKRYLGGSPKESNMDMTFTEFGQFFHDLRDEIAQQNIHAATNLQDGSIPESEFLNVLESVAPPSIPRFMQKNITQLLYMDLARSGSKVTYPYFTGLVGLLRMYEVVQAALSRRCEESQKGRLSRHEFEITTVTENGTDTIASLLTVHTHH